MKCLIVYYSMSGNTGKIAQAIHKGAGQVAEHCDIVTIQGANGVPGMRKGHFLEYDLIGIGSPVWRGTITPNVLSFINSLPSREELFLYSNCYEKELSAEEKQQCFFFLCHGKWPGAAVERIWNALETRGLTVIGWDDWYGDAFMSYAQKPWQTHGHPDEIDLKEAEAFGKEIAERSIRISRGETDLVQKLPTGDEYLKLYGRSYNPNTYVPWIKHHYGVKIDMEKCTKCGLCEDNCPMGAIDLKAKNPILPTCMWCTTCEMICPVGAVDVNMEELKKDRGITKEEIREKAQALQEKFVAGQESLVPEKRMRWLMNPDDLWKNGYVADITGNPRVVIRQQKWHTPED